MLIMIGMAVSLYRALSEEEHDSRLRQIRRLRQLEALEKRLPD